MLVFCLIKQLQTESPYVYHPPTKLRKCNVFIRVCMFVHRGTGFHVAVTHDTLDITIQRPPETSLYRAPWTWVLTVQAPSGSDIWWPRLEIYSNVFTSIKNNANVFSVMRIDFVHMSIYILNDEGRKRYYFPRDFKKYSFTTKQFRKKQINSGRS